MGPSVQERRALAARVPLSRRRQITLMRRLTRAQREQVRSEWQAIGLTRSKWRLLRARSA